jgi:hypothetical protein
MAEAVVCRNSDQFKKQVTRLLSMLAPLPGVVSEQHKLPGHDEVSIFEKFTKSEVGIKELSRRRENFSRIFYGEQWVALKHVRGPDRARILCEQVRRSFILNNVHVTTVTKLKDTAYNHFRLCPFFNRLPTFTPLAAPENPPAMFLLEWLGLAAIKMIDRALLGRGAEYCAMLTGKVCSKTVFRSNCCININLSVASRASVFV